MSETLFKSEDMKILLVDDTPANINLLTQTLEPEGYRLAVAVDGEKALKAAEHFVPDLVLLDVMMPGMNGFEVCRRLRALPNCKHTSVIFCTAKQSTEDIVEGFDAGGVDYITKPFRLPEVRARVRTVLQANHMLHTLDTQNQDLIELNDLKNKFMGIAAHDLRSPLNSICMLADIMLELPDLPDEKRISYLNNVLDTGHNMLMLINNLLDFSAIESGRLSLLPQLSAMHELIKERVEIHRIPAERKQIQLQTHLHDVPQAKLDRNRISQVLDNIISNALKFSPSGSEIDITLNLASHYEGLEVCVCDQGPGFRPEDKEHLFKAFEPLSARPTDGEKSTGLGLAIVKKIIDAHHGCININNRPQGGAECRITLPIDFTQEH